MIFSLQAVIILGFRIIGPGFTNNAISGEYHVILTRIGDMEMMGRLERDKYGTLRSLVSCTSTDRSGPSFLKCSNRGVIYMVPLS